MPQPRSSPVGFAASKANVSKEHREQWQQQNCRGKGWNNRAAIQPGYRSSISLRMSRCCTNLPQSAAAMPLSTSRRNHSSCVAPRFAPKSGLSGVSMFSRLAPARTLSTVPVAPLFRFIALVSRKSLAPAQSYRPHSPPCPAAAARSWGSAAHSRCRDDRTASCC
jgi:hypothetical protein